MIDSLPNNQNLPPNLPIDPGSDRQTREPEDILEAVESSPAEVRRPMRETSPLPSLADKVAASRQPSISASLPPAMAPTNKTVTKEPFFSQGKKMLVAVFGVVVILGVLAGAGWYGYGLLTSSGNAVMPQITNTANDATSPAVNADNQANNQADVVTEPAQPLDTDRDGLTDQEENLYGTNSERVDTDRDGLTDQDEVKVFETDPNNPDSDGDTFLDGQEVRSGYDPKGTCRLLEVDQ